MPGKQPQGLSARKISGVALLAAGSAVMILYPGFFAWRLANTLHVSAGVCANLGMASLKAIQALAFDHSLFFSIALRMLVLFSAFTMTLIGLALLPKRGTTAAGRRSTSALPQGDQ
jgi:hypothetical protein